MLGIAFMCKPHWLLLPPKIICGGSKNDHVPCHLQDDAICMLLHSVLLRPIRNDHLFLNATIGCLRNGFPTVVQPKCLDFVSCQFKCAFAPSKYSNDLQCSQMYPVRPIFGLSPSRIRPILRFDGIHPATSLRMTSEVAVAGNYH